MGHADNIVFWVVLQPLVWFVCNLLRLGDFYCMSRVLIVYSHVSLPARWRTWTLDWKSLQFNSPVLVLYGDLVIPIHGLLREYFEVVCEFGTGLCQLLLSSYVRTHVRTWVSLICWQCVSYASSSVSDFCGKVPPKCWFTLWIFTSEFLKGESGYLAILGDCEILLKCVFAHGFGNSDGPTWLLIVKSPEFGRCWIIHHIYCSDYSVLLLTIHRDYILFWIDSHSFDVF